ncbi:MAG: alpha/beta hydrolase [Flavobacteriales bacterium]|nr:alpha/beta hydrolase [Flavobacteriales bacterium]
MDKKQVMEIDSERNILLNNGTSRPISLDFFNPKTSDSKPIVIFCHGFKGFKDWGHFNYVAERFSSLGFGFVKFNFSHNGSKAPDFFDTPDLEAFGQNNFSRELDDLDLVIDWVEEHATEFNWDLNRLFLMGHSRGGGVVLLKTSEDNRVKKCVTWASVQRFDRGMNDETLERWKSEGVMYVENSRTNVQMPLYYQLYEDFVKNKSRLDIQHNITGIEVPVLLIHGTADDVVPYQEAENLHRSIPKSQIKLLNGQMHSFGASHPFDGTISRGVEMVLEASIEFFDV